MSTKVCYRYNNNDNTFISEDIAYESPLEPGVFGLPANCTFTAPKKYGEFEIPVWNEKKWINTPDYRKHLDESGMYVGGKPYYDPKQYWWATEQYMKTVGDIPEGMEWSRTSKPESAITCRRLMDEVTDSKNYLDSTDKNYIELQAYKAGYRKYLTEEAVKELEDIELKRDAAASSIGPKNIQIASLKEAIKNQYGEEALNHI